MRKSLLFLMIVVLVSAFSSAFAQDTSRQGPPTVLLIVREDIKPGMMATHNRHSSEFAGIFNKLQTPNHRVALVPVAGSENEVIYITGARTFAELEGIQKATDEKLAAAAGGPMRADLDRLDKEAPALHAGMRDLFAVLRPDLSYGSEINISTMRYMAVNTVRVRPGQEAQYAEVITTLVKAARDKAKVDLHIAAFQVIAGTANTTYLFFRPMKSLAEYDLRIAARVREAMTDDQKKKADKLAGETIMFSETSVYAFNPQMSYVSKDMMAADPAFWTPKPAMMAKPKPKKRMMKAVAPPPPTD